MDEANWNYINHTLEEEPSYVLEKNIHKQYDRRLFFNYYCEDSFSLVSIQIVVLVFVFFLSLGYDVFIFVSIIRLPRMKSVTNYLTANIGLTNLVLISTIPIIGWAWYSQTWDWGSCICKMTAYLQTSSIVVCQWTVTLLALDRYRYIVVPPSNSLFTTSSAVFNSVLVWLLTLLFFIPINFWFNKVTDKNAKVCTLILPPDDDFPFYMYLYFGVLILIWVCPLPLSTYLFFQSYLKMMASRSIWASSLAMMDNDGTNRHGHHQSEVSVSDVIFSWTRRFSSQAGSTRRNSLSQLEETRLNKRLRVARILCTNAIFAAPLWLLTSSIFIFFSIDLTRSYSEKRSLLKCNFFNYGQTVTFFSSLVNLIYYGSYSDIIRGKFMRMFSNTRPSRQVKEIAAPAGTKISNKILPALKQENFEISEK